jgi:hypothetical protein
MNRARLTLAVGLVAVAAAIPSAVQAGTYTFQPNPANLGDLEHGLFYTWGIAWSVPTGEQITAATLSIHNLNDWQVESGDILYIHLLDQTLPGVHSWYDGEGGGDAFAGQGVLLTTYTDDDGPPNPPEDWSYSFTPTQVTSLTSYAANGQFGLGFDADCHYYNDGVTLSVETAGIPEPASLLLLALGGIFATRRR